MCSTNGCRNTRIIPFLFHFPFPPRAIHLRLYSHGCRTSPRTKIFFQAFSSNAFGPSVFWNSRRVKWLLRSSCMKLREILERTIMAARSCGTHLRHKAEAYRAYHGRKLVNARESTGNFRNFEFSSGKVTVCSSEKAFRSLILRTYPFFNMRRASRMQLSQFVLMRLNEHTTTSTIWPSSSTSEPGTGSFPQISVATMNGFAEMRSYDSTL